MDKKFLNYDLQLDKISSEKQIICDDNSKELVIKAGYFNLINGYKEPFSTSKVDGKHSYIPGTTLNDLYSLKEFDDNLRLLLFKYITQIESQIRTLIGYKLDEVNQENEYNWFDVKYYDEDYKIADILKTIGKTQHQVYSSKNEYISFYIDKNRALPSWVIMKVVTFSNLINILKISKKKLKFDIKELYDIDTDESATDVLIGALNWIRIIRNRCAHNERVYNIAIKNSRILDKYVAQLPKSYSTDTTRKIFDLFIYFKYFLSNIEFQQFINEFKSLVEILNNSNINNSVLEKIRANMGIKDYSDLDLLQNLDKKEINYIAFDKSKNIQNV